MSSTCSSPNRPPQRSWSPATAQQPQTRPCRPCRETASSQGAGPSTAAASTRSLWLRSVKSVGFGLLRCSTVHLLSTCVTPCQYCAVSPAGAPAGEAQRDVQEDAGTAPDGGEVPPSHRARAGHGETQTRRLHEQERRLHQPSGAGEREVRFIFFFLICLFFYSGFCG